MDPQWEKAKLKEELDCVFPTSELGETTIAEPESLKELLAHIIEAIPDDEI